MDRKGSRKRKKVVEIDPEKVRKAIEEASQKGLGIFPGRPGKGPCGGCDVVISPRSRYR